MLCKHRDLNVDPQSPAKPGMGARSVISVDRGEPPGAYEPVPMMKKTKEVLSHMIWKVKTLAGVVL